MLNNIKNYLSKEDYRLSIIPSGIHILFFTKILDIENSSIKLEIGKKIVLIKGEDLVMCKLDGKELLIRGTIKEVKIDER